MNQHRILLVLVLLCVSLASCEEVIEFSSLPFLYNDTRKRTAYLNTDYLGAGYHILKGNPWTLDSVTGRDPGWITNRILSLGYSAGQKTTDDLYYIPDGSSVQRIGNCQYSASSVQTYGMHSYTSNLAAYASVSGGSPSGSFSLSAGYQQTYSSTSVSQQVLMQTVANCQVYTASLYPFTSYAYTPVSPFLSDLNALPATYDPANPSPFTNFFNSWGTHVSQQIYMGGRASSTYTMTYNQYNDLQSSAIDINAAASASWGVYSGDATASSSSSTTATNYFKSKVSSTTISYLGPPPPVNPSNLNNWLNSVVGSPFVLSYVLVPISNLVQSTASASKVSAIQAALNDLCSKTSGCQNIANVPSDPTHNPTLKSCRWCAGCGQSWPVESGSRLQQGDWSSWDGYDSSCGGTYQDQGFGAIKFCCGASPVDGTGMCRLCSSCGGAWTLDQGSRINAGDWGPYQTWGAGCAGGYDGNWNPPHLCCAAEAECKMCDGCGAGLVEVGRVRHNGDWGEWNIYGSGCSGGQSGSWNENVFCCKP